MSIYKRGKVYWYKFMWNGDVIRESTRQGKSDYRSQHGIGAQNSACQRAGWDPIEEASSYAERLLREPI